MHCAEQGGSTDSTVIHSHDLNWACLMPSVSSKTDWTEVYSLCFAKVLWVSILKYVNLLFQCQSYMQGSSHCRTIAHNHYLPWQLENASNCRNETRTRVLHVCIQYYILCLWCTWQTDKELGQVMQPVFNCLGVGMHLELGCLCEQSVNRVCFCQSDRDSNNTQRSPPLPTFLGVDCILLQYLQVVPGFISLWTCFVSIWNWSRRLSLLRRHSRSLFFVHVHVLWGVRCVECAMSLQCVEHGKWELILLDA